ncbi:hypothetical protein CEXT_588151 [Caerostris extrusa]|uniref:Uncharacterized protein n=1 Tax=Caerostris extrusa TaxID=172846 RepID=A0AAV4XG06_CAEEX|nr:hypothetical protein CEXT_588151 [Caerostris extrusa]
MNSETETHMSVVTANFGKINSSANWQENCILYPRFHRGWCKAPNKNCPRMMTSCLLYIFPLTRKPHANPSWIRMGNLLCESSPKGISIKMLSVSVQRIYPNQIPPQPKLDSIQTKGRRFNLF